MPSLNVKNVPAELYRRLQQRARRQRRSLSQEVLHILEAALQKPQQLSIMELEGLGKEVWAKLPGEAHVRREREAWD